MKKLISLFLILSQLLPATTLAAISGPDRADIGGPINAVPNSSSQRGFASWVKGGSPLFSATTSAGERAAGVGSFFLNAGSASDYVETPALTLTDDTTGDCEASISVKGNATGYTLQLMSGANVLNSIALTNNAGFKTHAFNYPCGQNYKLRVASNGDNALINFGAVYWGKATNTTLVSPITEWQSYTPAIVAGGGSITASTLTGKFRRVGDSLEFQLNYVYSSGTGAATDIAISLPGGLTIDSGKTASGNGLFGAGFYYTTATGFKSLEVRGNSPTSLKFTRDSVAAHIWGTDADESGAAIEAYGIIPIVGWTSQTAVRQDQTFDRTGEVMSYMGACPANTVSAMGMTIGKSSGDYQGEQYYALYAKLWRSGLPLSGSSYGVSISVTGGTSATSDWAAGRTLKLELRDLFLRGISPNAFGNPTAGLYQADAMQGHIHQIQTMVLAGATGYNPGFVGTGNNNNGYSGNTAPTLGPSIDGTYGTPRTAVETRPMNVGVNYCVNYTGTQPAPVLVGGGLVSESFTNVANASTATFSWTAPASVDQVHVCGHGSGGGGGGGNTAGTQYGGNGGGGAATTCYPTAVTPGASYTVTVPAGGAGGAAGNDGGNGTDASLGSLVIFKGAQGGRLAQGDQQTRNYTQLGWGNGVGGGGHGGIGGDNGVPPTTAGPSQFASGGTRNSLNVNAGAPGGAGDGVGGAGDAATIAGTAGVDGGGGGGGGYNAAGGKGGPGKIVILYKR